jgi:hypothetical protein
MGGCGVVQSEKRRLQDGSLLVAADASESIWRISHIGE